MPQQWLRIVVVNGHSISYNAFLHPFPLVTDINITPYIRPGKENRVELRPNSILPPQYSSG